MRTGVVPLAAWGLALGAIALLGRLQFGLATLPTLLLAGAGAGSVLTGAVAAAGARAGARRERRHELLVTGSAATTVLVIGAALVLVGVAIDASAFLWPGAGAAVLGLGGLVREWRAARRLLRGEGGS